MSNNNTLMSQTVLDFHFDSLPENIEMPKFAVVDGAAAQVQFKKEGQLKRKIVYNFKDRNYSFL
ncbi:MAG: hypothetical protein RR614_14585 [Eubacterium sp.]